MFTLRANAACLINFTPTVKSCTEYVSTNPALIDSLKTSCTANPMAKWVDSCPGNLGCRYTLGGIESTLWFQNAETREVIGQLCDGMHGTVVTK